MKELRSFLGICSFLRGNIPKFSFKAQPLFDLLEKPEHFHWGSDQHKAFENYVESPNNYVFKQIVRCKV